MKAKEVNALEFLKEPKQLLIPIYQRTYSWELEHCRRLWDDVLRCGSDDSVAGHFVGALVYVEKGLYQVSSLSQLLVIDGQQRLTTLTLLFAALAKALSAREQEDMPITPRKIRNYYLFNSEEEGELRYKLLLTQADRTTLKALLDETPLPSEHSTRIVDNYKFFEREVSKDSVDLRSVYNGLSKLILVDIVLTRGQDNPQLIFESLNSTGLDLSQADLVRNYVLMGLEPQQQDKLYETFWLPMERNFGLPESSALFNKFMRDYLTLKTGRIAKTDDVYENFKTICPDRAFPTVELLVADIYRFSHYFTNIALLREPDARLRKCFEHIAIHKMDVVYPLLLHFYDHYTRDLMSVDMFCSVVELLESYLFRRSICALPNNSLNRFFVALLKEIDLGNPLESLAAHLALKDAQLRFPTDGEFVAELTTKDVYNFRLRNYLLGRLENSGRSKETVDVENYTIEHIMPQTDNLREEWKQALGSDYETVQSTYLHRLGNLTLTGYNSELSDRPFEEKRDMDGGFADSPIRLNRSLAKLSTWNEHEIIARGNHLAEQCAQIWKYPQVSPDVLAALRQQANARQGQYTLENHPFLNGEMKPLFDSLRKRIINIDSSVKEEVKKLYVAYKSGTNFVDVVGQKRGLLLTLNMPYKAIDDPLKMCKNMTGVGKWGNGDIQVDIWSEGQIDAVMKLIQQAFEYQTMEDVPSPSTDLAATELVLASAAD